MNKIQTRRLLIFLASFVSILAYVLYSAGFFQIGFPLDDAWIHQTYARSLGETGVWTFLPGKPSAGSTAPLWTGLLSLGYLLGLKPLIFSSLLGTIILASVGLIYQRVSDRVNAPGKIPWFGLFAVFEWHLVWAALSGMETLLFALAVLLVLSPLIVGEKPRTWQGLIVGAAVWIRPEGVTLLAPVLLTVLLSPGPWKKKLKPAILALIGFSAVMIPYLLMNQTLSGSLWPNTFYAKQGEYSVLLSQPLMIRVWSMALPFLTGAGVLLAPGFLWYAYKSVRDKRWGAVSAVLWCVGFVGMYSLRMPVDYQHGRYMIPAMPVFFLVGLLGSFQWISTRGKGRFTWVLSRSGLLALAAVLTGFWLMGADAYAKDVAIIQSEMVQVSHWIADNTPVNSKIAAHDIGALGYFSGREILDLAGLIDPTIIPFMRDEVIISNYLGETKAEYLVTFPEWYPILIRDRSPVYCTFGRFSPEAGGENMCVYNWRPGSN